MTESPRYKGTFQVSISISASLVMFPNKVDNFISNNYHISSYVVKYFSYQDAYLKKHSILLNSFEFPSNELVMET